MASSSQDTKGKGKEDSDTLQVSEEVDVEESTVRPRFPPEEEAVSNGCLYTCLYPPPFLYLPIILHVMWL